MEFPKRPPQHVTETASWKVLQSRTPDMWMVRGVSERDYGIDAYIELATTKGDVTGELCSIQLKGTESIDWKAGNNRKRATVSIGVATVNYWMNLPVPVFL